MKSDKKSVEWEKDVEDRFGHFTNEWEIGSTSPVEEIKDFIHTLLLKQREAFVEMIGEDENLYERERKKKKYDWRTSEENGANNLRAELRKKLQVSKIIEE